MQLRDPNINGNVSQSLTPRSEGRGSVVDPNDLCYFGVYMLKDFTHEVVIVVTVLVVVVVVMVVVIVTVNQWFSTTTDSVGSEMGSTK